MLSDPSRRAKSSCFEASCIAAAIALFPTCILPAAAQSPARPGLGKFLLGADITGIETTPSGAPAGSGPGAPIGSARAGGAGAAGRAGRAPFTYQEDGKPSDELTILHNRGWNAFRVRIFVPPVRSAPNNPMVNAVPLCKRIRSEEHT